MAGIWWVFGLVAAVAWAVALVDIVRRRRLLTRGQLAAWVLIVLIFPVLGTILYFAIGRRPETLTGQHPREVHAGREYDPGPGGREHFEKGA